MSYSKPGAYANPDLANFRQAMMLRILLLSAALFGMTAAAPPADARPRDREQDAALKGLQQGRMMPLRAIESAVVPRMRGFDYLGPELDPSSGRYRLKFLRDGQVVWVDVDARTGHIVGHSGR
jgi:uncharacterized membrane protein YkoI